MSLLLLIDGYNVLAPVAPPGGGADANWLHRERMRLIDRLATHLSAETCKRCCVVFDAANPPRDRPAESLMQGIFVRFAVGYPEADDLLEEIIAEHSAPKQLAVVSSDHRVQAAARRRGATCFESQNWLDDLLEGKVNLAVATSGAEQGSGQVSEKPTGELNASDVSDWLREFGIDP